MHMQAHLHLQEKKNFKTFQIRRTEDIKIYWRDFPGGVQWLRICLPMKGIQVQSLVWEDAACHGATKPVRHNYWACALEPASHNYWARVPQLLKPTCLEPMLCNKRSHHNEKLTCRNEEYPPLAATRESPRSKEDPTQPKIKINKINKFIFKKIMMKPVSQLPLEILQCCSDCPTIHVH